MHEYVFQLYRETLEKPDELDATVELLEHTSKMVEIYLDRRPISMYGDERVKELMKAEQYFKQFVDKKPEESFTTQTTFDTICTLSGTLELLRILTSKRLSVAPGFINSDVVENHFCMVRSLFNGANDNPSYFAYKGLQNSVILTQPINLPKKRNCDTLIEILVMKHLRLTWFS